MTSDNCDVCHDRGPLNCPTIVGIVGGIAACRMAIGVALSIGLIDDDDDDDPGWCIVWQPRGV